MRAAAGAVLDRRTLFQFTRYGLSGGAVVAVQLAGLAALVELAGSPPVLASLLAFACATVVSYTLQHRFVFSRSRGHGAYFPRYLAVASGTMLLGIAYLASQIITIGAIVPLSFAINRGFTFAG